MPAASDESGQVHGDEDAQWVLLLEDDVVIARSIARSMTRAAGMPVHASRSLDQALRWLRCMPDPAAVVTDFDLDDGNDGVTAIRRLREAGCKAPAAILTGAPERALSVLTASPLDEIVPVFSKLETTSRLWEWLDQLRLCFSETA